MLKTIDIPIRQDVNTMQIAALNIQAAALSIQGGNEKVVQNLIAQTRCLWRGLTYRPNEPDFISEVELLTGPVPTSLNL